jgi:two-component system KDP operon response regulator KdpE
LEFAPSETNRAWHGNCNQPFAARFTDGSNIKRNMTMNTKKFTRPMPAAIPSPSSNRKILIVDDDDMVRESLASVLASEGYEVCEAMSGMEAVSRAIENHPDLVLLDLNMPHCDGWNAFDQLDKVTPLVPVIVITARPNQYDTAVRLGVDAFMEKPLNIPILMRAVKRLTTEDDAGHMRRITDPGFVTQLLEPVAPRAHADGRRQN